VEDCRADLSNAKDYHRRHKVCNAHSKASKALVGNVMQRFCQQCSRSVWVAVSLCEETFQIVANFDHDHCSTFFTSCVIKTAVHH
jgi:hypothetical protein